MLITKRVEFSASHICRDPRLNDEENYRLFGAASNPHGHGHNYVLDVTLKGEPDPTTGMILDLKELKSILEREILTPFDHRFLNYEVPPFDRTIPTVENIAREIWRRLVSAIPGGEGTLDNVRLYETPDLYVEYSGDR